jgi:glycosyltransferase involved in cell wall biosynthesis
MALRKFHGKALALTCVYAAPLRRKFSRRLRVAGTPLRVCHVTCSFDLGGTQRQIKHLCEKNSDPRFIHETIEAFPEHNYLYRRHIRLSAADYAGRSLWTRPLGRRVMDSDQRSLQLIQIYKFTRDFGRLKPDVVVGWGHEIAMLAFAAAAFARVPRVVFCIRTWNPDRGWTTIPRLLFRAHRNMIPWTDAIIVNSSLLQADYAQWMAIAPGRIDICPNGIELVPNDPDAVARLRREVRQRLNIPAGAFVLSNVGRFSGEKGQLLLLRAYERLIRESGRDDIFAVLCGDGPLLGEARAFAERRGLAQALFPGRVEDVRSYLSASDVFVMPSDFEGMPNAMMEAMAMGLPCVSTNRSGALDIARDHQEALFVETGDAEGLADRIGELLRDPSERSRLGTNARRRLDDFSMEKMTARFNDILVEAAGRKP